MESCASPEGDSSPITRTSIGSARRQLASREFQAFGHFLVLWGRSRVQQRKQHTPVPSRRPQGTVHPRCILRAAVIASTRVAETAGRNLARGSMPADQPAPQRPDRYASCRCGRSSVSGAPTLSEKRVEYAARWDGYRRRKDRAAGAVRREGRVLRADGRAFAGAFPDLSPRGVAAFARLVLTRAPATTTPNVTPGITSADSAAATLAGVTRFAAASLSAANATGFSCARREGTRSRSSRPRSPPTARPPRRRARPALVSSPARRAGPSSFQRCHRSSSLSRILA